MAKRMRKKEFCVALAKDVIAQVKRKNLVVESGIYCRVGSWGEHDMLNGSQQLDALIQKENRRCNVCALGSLVAAYALAKDDTSVLEASNRDTIVERLAPYFGDRQLDLIEATFEGTIQEDRDGDLYDENERDNTCSQKELRAAKKFSECYADDEERLLAIMRNIIKNDGRFVPKEAK